MIITDGKIAIPKINELLKDLESPNSKELKFIKKQEINTPIRREYDDGIQGEENTFEKIFEIISQPGLFLKIGYYTDSYGSGEYIRSVQFVTVKKKEVIVYE